MRRWSLFLLAVLLTLSLPLRASAVAPPPCGTTPAMIAMEMFAPIHRIDTRSGQRPAAAACHHAGGNTTHMTHTASQCGACATCFAGAVAAGPRVSPPGFDVTIVQAARPASDPVPRFLTEGIDRPPRFFLA
jgi:hypothetical protein